jgi:hypothetical protein
MAARQIDFPSWAPPILIILGVLIVILSSIWVGLHCLSKRSNQSKIGTAKPEESAVPNVVSTLPRHSSLARKSRGISLIQEPMPAMTKQAEYQAPQQAFGITIPSSPTTQVAPLEGGAPQGFATAPAPAGFPYAGPGHPMQGAPSPFNEPNKFEFEPLEEYPSGNPAHPTTIQNTLFPQQHPPPPMHFPQGDPMARMAPPGHPAHLQQQHQQPPGPIGGMAGHDMPLQGSHPPPPGRESLMRTSMLGSTQVAMIKVAKDRRGSLELMMPGNRDSVCSNSSGNFLVFPIATDFDFDSPVRRPNAPLNATVHPTPAFSYTSPLSKRSQPSTLRSLSEH